MVLFTERKYSEDVLGVGADETKCYHRDGSRGGSPMEQYHEYNNECTRRGGYHRRRTYTSSVLKYMKMVLTLIILDTCYNGQTDTNSSAKIPIKFSDPKYKLYAITLINIF